MRRAAASEIGRQCKPARRSVSTPTFKSLWSICRYSCQRPTDADRDTVKPASRIVYKTACGHDGRISHYAPPRLCTHVRGGALPTSARTARHTQARTCDPPVCAMFKFPRMKMVARNEAVHNAYIHTRPLCGARTRDTSPCRLAGDRRGGYRSVLWNVKRNHVPTTRDSCYLGIMTDAVPTARMPGHPGGSGDHPATCQTVQTEAARNLLPA